MKTVKLHFKVKCPILACGADMKCAFALAKGSEAYLFDGFGDLSDPDNLERYEKAVRREVKKLRIRPAIIACDLHPEYFSAKFAERFQSVCSRAHLSVPYNCELYQVQHHEAHVAATIVDNSLKGGVIGVAFDGTGYGTDGNIWGGEFFVGNLRKLTRAAHLAYIPMPGGEAAIKEPYRMAVSYLYYAFGRDLFRLNLELIKKFYKRGQAPFIESFIKLVDKRINSPLTSSAGRLFDAVGSLVLAKRTVEKEAELPMELEKMAIGLCRETYDLGIKTVAGMLEIDCRRIIKGVVKDLSKHADRATVSSKFHNTVAEIILKVSVILRKKFRVNKVVLSGGVFQNAFLSAIAKELLAKSGFEVFVHSRIPANDSGIPIGQVAIANARARCA